MPLLHAGALSGTALVRHGPSLNGTVDGSIQQMLPESVTLNGGAIVTGDILVPGLPTVHLNGKPKFLGTFDLDGAATPSNHQITLNGGASLAHVVRRVDPVPLTTVAAPALPAGARIVTVTVPGQAIGPWSTLRHLTLNGGVGDIAVPPGTYGDFTANGGTSFTLGVAGATQPSAYNFQRINLNGQAQIRVVGPVVLTVAYGFSGNGSIGAGAHPEWLTLNVYSGGFTLNGGCHVYGFVNAPTGTVIVNGNSQLVGGVSCDRLTVNGGGLLRLVSPISENLPPVAHPDSFSLDEDASVVVTLAGSDPEGAPVTFVIASRPGHGSLHTNSGPITVYPTAPLTESAIRYVPLPDYAGSDSFTFYVSDGQLESPPATIALLVRPINDAPVASADPVTLPEDAAEGATITLRAVDEDSPIVTFTIVVGPRSGQLLSGGGDAVRIYRPDPDFFGSDSFTFVAHDGALASEPVTVAITVTPVNDPPVAFSQNLVTREETGLDLVLTGFDVDGDALVFTRVNDPIGGGLSGAGASLRYEPLVNFADLDRFEFTVSDGQSKSAPATISIEVTNENDAPRAESLAVTMVEDAAAVITLAGSDDDGDPISSSIVRQPEHAQGELVVAGTTVTYRPVGDYFGTDSFTYKSTDVFGADSPEATVTITVEPVNDAPMAHAQGVSTDEDRPVDVALTGTDTEDSSVSFEIVQHPAQGELTHGVGPGIYRFVPYANQNGADQFTFLVRDSDGLASEAVVVPIAIRPVNDAPVALPQALEVAEDGELPFEFTSTDEEGDPVSYEIATPPQFGAITPEAATAAARRYTPSTNYHGSDSLTFIARDADASEPVTVSIIVHPVNDAPEASAPEVITDRNVPVTFTLVAHDVDGDALVFDLLTGPGHGTLETAAGPLAAFPHSDLPTPNLIYTPTYDFAGEDSLTFQARDPAGAASAIITVPIVVRATNRAPTSQSASLDTREDEPLALVLGASDPDGDALTYILVTLPAHGTLVGEGANRIYQASADYFGPDTFQFRVNDGLLDSEIATIEIDVAPIDDAPTGDDQNLVLDEDSTVSLRLAGRDPEGLPVTFTLRSLPANGSLVGAGGVVITSVTGDAIDSDSLSYVPAVDFNGDDGFSFTVSDGTSSSVLASVSLTVRPVNDSPEVAALHLSTLEDTSVAFDLSAIDVDGAPVGGFSFILLSGPAHGALLSGDVPIATYPFAAGTAPAPTFQPGHDRTDTVTFAYVASDGALQSAPATVTIDIAPVNDAPVAVSGSYSVPEDSLVAVSLSGSDVDGDPLTFTVASGPTAGVLIIEGVPVASYPATGITVGSITYRPHPDFSGSDSFDYVVNDGTVDSATATIGLEVVAVNDPPVAIGQVLATPENTPVEFDLLASDPDGGDLVFTLLGASGPENGSVTISGHRVSYTPDPGFRGLDSFRFEVIDGSMARAQATVEITVKSVNAPPKIISAPNTTHAIRFRDAPARILDLSEWLPVSLASTDESAEPRWILSGDLAGATQKTNCPPSALLSDIHVQDGAIAGQFSVETDADNDTFGIIFGYQDPTHFYLLDWKQEDQTEPGGDYGYAAEGLTLRRVSADSPLQNHELWRTAGSGDRVNILYHKRIPYNDRTKYKFQLIHRAPRIVVVVFQGRTVIDTIDIEDATYSGGRFGLYCFSQEESTFSGLGYERFATGDYLYQALAVDPDGDAVALSLESAPGFVSFDAPTGLLRISVGELLPGDYPISISATDPFGASDVQHYVLHVEKENEPPYVVGGGNRSGRGTDSDVELRGVVLDDGLPDEASLQSTWSKVDGPGEVTFADEHAPLTTARFSQPGLYLLKLSADDTLLASSDLVEVRVGVPTAVGNLDGMALWWPSNGTPEEVLTGHDSELVNGLGFGSGCVSQGFIFDGVDDHAYVAGDATTDIASGGSFTVEFWVNPAESRYDPRLVRWVGSSEGVRIRQFGNSLYANVRESSGVDHELIVNSALPTGQWTHVALTYNHDLGLARIYINGSARTGGTWTPFIAQTNGNFYVGSGGGSFKGALDELTLYRRALSAQEINAIFAAGATGKAPVDGNAAPSVHAGSDHAIDSTAQPITLGGSVLDDGLPDEASLQSTWSKVDGPGEVTFADEHAPLTTARFSQPGLYLLKLSADDTLLASSDLVEVRVGVPTAVGNLDGMALWWPSNGTPEEVLTGHDSELVNGLGFGSGCVSQGFIFDGVDDHAYVAGDATTDIASGGSFTVEFWVNPAESRYDPRLVRWVGSSEGVRIRQFGNSLYANVRESSGVDHELIVNSALPTGQWTHVALTYNHDLGLARIYINGSARTGGTWTPFIAQTNGNFYVGSGGGSFKGALDELTLYRRALSAQEINAIFAAGATGKAPVDGNSRPKVEIGGVAKVFAGIPVSIGAVATDDGQPSPLTYLWSMVDGPGTVQFAQPTSLKTVIEFDAPGYYTLGFSANDSQLTGVATIGVSVAAPLSSPPAVAISGLGDGMVLIAGDVFNLDARATDADGAIEVVEFFDHGQRFARTSIRAPGSSTIFRVQLPKGFKPGQHQISARAIDDSGMTATSAPVTIRSVSDPGIPPVVAISSPADEANVSGQFFVSGFAYSEILSRWMIQVRPKTAPELEPAPWETERLGSGIVGSFGDTGDPLMPGQFGSIDFSDREVGPYEIRLVATDQRDRVASTPLTTIYRIAPDSAALVAELSAPSETGVISAPVELFGIVASPLLSRWSVEVRLKSPDDSIEVYPWTVISSGAAPVGNPATASEPAETGSLGHLDPTLLLNGIYEIRLVAEDTQGVSAFAGPLAVVVDGNMKVGAFSLAFEDLSVPVAGIPISIVRTYDSRDARVGDFGPGWNIAINNILVQKNRNLGLGWVQDSGGSQTSTYYFVEPLGKHLVSVVFPDGETHRFETSLFVPRESGPAIPDNAQWLFPIRSGQMVFKPIGDTTSTLEVDGDKTVNLTGFLGDDYLTQGFAGTDPEFNPTRFRLTTQDGTVFILDERLGLLEMHDLIGNSLVLQRDAQEHVTRIVSTQVAGAAGEAVSRSVTIHRDATGHVAYIEDLDGDSVDFTYDEAGRLATVIDRTLNVTEFHYEHPAFPYFLTRIVDPRGHPAIRCEYDDTGRLVKQIDASGRETVFERGIDTTGRFERIQDRLGHETTYYYDDRGNITLKIDPEGARTTFSYYADSDRVRFETDHYGNSKSFAYDARGNVTVETLGAILSDDPASPTTGYVTRTSYNSLGAPTSLSDPDGRLQTFSYDPASNNLLSHTTGAVAGDPTAGDRTTFTYLDDGSIDTITDALGNVSRHTYDLPFADDDFPGAVKRVTITVTDPAGGAGSDPSNVTATVLRTSRTLYDASEKALAEVVTRTRLDGSTEQIVTRHRYDADDRLVATILPDGRVNETRYNAIGKEAASVQWKSVADYESGDDALARITSYEYDARGNQVLVTHPDAGTEASAFDAENRRLWSQDRRGARTFFEYDKVGRLTATILPDDNDGLGAAAPVALDDARLADNSRTTTIYDLVGRVRFQIDEEGATTEFTYEDGCGCAMRRKEMIQHLSAGNLVTSYQYDNAGNVRFVTDPRGSTVETRYDEQGRPARVIYPATDEHPSTETVTTYDALGRRVAMTDQEGRITRYRYDALGRLIEVRQYLDQALAADDTDLELPASNSGVVSTRYSYDESGNLTTQTDALGRTTTYETDTLGRRVKRILPKDAGEPSALSEVLDYDAWGQLWHRTDFAGRTTTFEYDVLGRLRAKAADPAHPSLSYSNAAARIEYDYDLVGQREAARTYRANGTLLYSESTPHDVRGRLDYKDTAGGRLDYDTYENGLLKDVVSSNPGGVNIGYRYDALNRLAFVDDTSTGTMRTTGYAYNANGSLEAVSYANGVTHAYQYDTLNRLRDVTVRHLSSGIRHQDYRLRASGHRREIVETDARYSQPATRSYQYDPLYRLTGETISGDAHGHDGAVTYTLDKVGNRSSRVSSVSSVPSVVNQSFNARDWLDGDTYDANGNTQTGRLSPLDPGLSPEMSGTDIFDFENRLIVRIRSDGTSVNLAYDADGNRIGKTILSGAGDLIRWTTWLVDTNNLTGYAQVFEERTTTFGAASEVIDAVTKTYTYGSDLISQAVSTSSGSSSLAFFSYDGHGSVRELTDETGAITDRYDYDAFGVLLRHEGTSDNAYLYCGEQWDADLALYFLRARFMNPDSGRFWNMDTYEGSAGDPISLHKYLYASANPVTFVDPSGRWSLTEVVLATWSIGLRVASATIRVFPAAATVGRVLAVGTSFALATANVFWFATDEEFRGMVVSTPGGVGIVAADVSRLVGYGERLLGIARTLRQGIPMFRLGQVSNPSVSSAPGHQAEVSLFDKQGKFVTQWGEVSGTQTPEQIAMGFPRGAQASHTEIKAITRVHLSSGETLIIRGTLPPCANCKGAMRAATSTSGARIEYHYAVGDREEGERLIIEVWENGRKL